MKIKILLLLLMFVQYLSINAQIQINTVIPPPYPQTYEEALGFGNNSFLVLTNTNQTQSYEIKLTASVSADNGISVAVSPEAVPSQPITLAPGETRTIFGQELEALYLNYSQDDIIYKGTSFDELANNPYLPEGVYTFCIKAFSYNTGIPLSDENISGCAPPIFITTITPPIVTFPFDEQDVLAITPQQVVFSWTPVSFNSPDIRYAFQMVDYTDMNVNIYDLLDESDFLFYSEENIIGNTLIYGANLPGLQFGHDYAIRVKAYLLGNELNIQNDGFSDVVRFHYSEGSNPFSITDLVPDNNIIDFDNDFDIGGLLDIGSYETKPGTGNTVDKIMPITTTDLGCDGGCNTTVPTNITTAELVINSTVNIGIFKMEVKQVSGTQNGGYSGYGFVQSSSFFPYPIKVNFTGVKINTSSQVINGEAVTEVRTGSWLENSWDNIQKNFKANSWGNNPEEFFNKVDNPDFRLEKWKTLTESASITLPAGYGEGNYRVQITKLIFKPEIAKFDAMVMIPVPDDVNGAKHLVFTATDICISPSGPSLGSKPVELDLSSTLRYKASNNVALEITASGSSSLGTGTHVELDCNGFYKASIAGRVVFSPNILKAENSSGVLNKTDTLAAAFSAEFESWDSWIAEVAFTDENKEKEGKLSSTRFQYSELEGYTFKLDYAKYDHHLTTNMAGMQFPASYEGRTGGDWQGLIISNLEVFLPKWAKDDSNDERVSFAANAMIVDESGVSGQFDGTNLVALEKGAIGGWDFSVDEVHLKVVSSTLEDGDMKGQLRIPISDDVFNYNANVQYADNNTQHNFVISNTGKIKMPAFLASLTLSPNSSISVDIDNNSDVLVEALLHGKIDLPDVVGEIPGCNLKDITFQDFAVRNKGEFLEIGSFGTEEASAGLSVAGFAVGLANMGLKELEDIKGDYKLGMDLNINLGTNDIEVSGATALFFIANKAGLTPRDTKLTHKTTGVTAFNVKGDLPGVKVDATVEFFKNTTLGHGFAGDFKANFLESINVKATAIFGSKEMGNETKKFFLIEGMGTLNQGIPFVGPLALYGFGGGLYYNMKLSDDFKLDTKKEASEALGMNSIASRYSFEEGQIGVKAAVVIGMTPSAEVFNADVSLGIEINSKSFGIEKMTLLGDGYMMTEILDRSDPMIKISADIGYNFSSDVLHGEMTMDLAAPKKDPLITANGKFVIHASPDLWYMKFGEPATPVHGEIDLKIVKPTLDTYFMAGMNLPAPILPSYVKQKFPNYQPVLMGTVSSGTGVAMGVHARVQSKIDIIVADMNLDVAAGFDFTAMSYSNSLCSGSSDFGINQWYANVQGYVYGDLAFTTLGYEWLSVYAGVIVEGALPNPTGFQGNVTFGVETFLVDFEVDDDFSVGEICEMQPMVNESGDVLVTSSPIQGLKIIDYINPSNQQEEVSLFNQPKVYFHINPYKVISYAYSDGYGDVITEKFKLIRKVKWQEKINGNFVDIPYEETWDSDEKSYTYQRIASSEKKEVELLRPETEHRFIVTVYPVKYGSSTRIKDEGTDNPNDYIEEKKVAYYHTVENVEIINEAHIDFCLPYDRQRFVTIDNYNDAKIKFNISYKTVFDKYLADGYKLEAKLYDLKSSDQVSITLNFDKTMFATFDISSLKSETTYKIVFTATKETMPVSNIISAYNSSINSLDGSFFNASSKPINDVSAPIVKKMFTYHFRTSKYRTIEEKMSSYHVESTSVAIKNSNLDLTPLEIKVPSGDFLDLSFMEDDNPDYNSINTETDFTTYKEIHLKLRGGEPFDTYDIYGHTFDNSFLTKKIVDFRYSGTGVWYNHGDLFIDVVAMRNDMSISDSDTYREPYPGMNRDNIHRVDARLWDTNFKMKNNSGSDLFSLDYRIVGVSDPLSDIEVGVSGATQNASGLNTYSHLFSNNTSVTSLNQMEIIYKGDLTAKKFYLEIIPIYRDKYKTMTSGNYNFSIETRDANIRPEDPPYQRKDFNPQNIQIR